MALPNPPSIVVISSNGSQGTVLKTSQELKEDVSIPKPPISLGYERVGPNTVAEATHGDDANATKGIFPRCRPPLSRQSTQTNLDRSDLAHGSCPLEYFQQETERRIQKAWTGHWDSAWSNSTPPDNPPKLQRSQTDGIVGSTKLKRQHLADEITSKMKMMGRIGLDEPKYYLPDELLSSLMTEENIKKALKKPEDDLIKFAKDNPKVFAITLIVFSGDKRRSTRAMKSFKEHKFMDNSLPVADLSSQGTCHMAFNWRDSSSSDGSELSEPDDFVFEPCKHNPEANAFHFAPWKDTNFEIFFDKQWSFLIQDFSADKFKYKLGDHVILPFGKPNDANIDGGHFGDVFPAIMLAKNQNMIETTSPTIIVAIKEMKQHTGKDYDNHGNWKREVKALRVFNRINHQHIVRGIGAFIQRRKRFILMEWADGGDLRHIWKRVPCPHLDLTQAHVKQFLVQFRGLADALEKMHNYKVGSDGYTAGVIISAEEGIEPASSVHSSQPSKPEGSTKSTIPDVEVSHFGDHESAEPGTSELVEGLQTIDRRVQFVKGRENGVKARKPEPPHDTENWRHGDLKPDNILSFKDDDSSWLGILKLADLGRARQHVDKTGKRNGTSEMFSTYYYDPPEVWTDLGKGRSRLVDMWSFGCVLLESVIWLFFGLDELLKFKSRPLGLGSLYWTDESLALKTAKLNDVTFDWIRQLLKDPECRPREQGSSAMRDLIELVSRKLIVMKLPKDHDTPEKRCRISSKALVEELDSIIKKGERDPSYLFSGNRREGIKAPQMAHLEQVPAQKKDFLDPNDARLNVGNIVQNPTRAPWVVRPSFGYGSRLDSYHHNFSDKWEYVEDNTFASTVLSLPRFDAKQLLPMDTSMLCVRCQALNWDAPTLEIKDSFDELRRRKEKEGCKFCALLLRKGEAAPNTGGVKFEMVTSGLRMNKSVGLPILTIRQIPIQGSLSNQFSRYNHIGLPRIPKGGSPAHFDIIRAWLDDCNQNHQNCRPARSTLCPTRLIDVGTIEKPSLRLVESSPRPQNERRVLKYVALSHPWGSSPPHRHFVTDVHNVEAHKRQIPEDLPQTLADAIMTTRHLKVRYIWIDCLCIIQGPGGDFAKEADCMETVFSSAYCVIAATGAEGSASGFLKRESHREMGWAKNEQDTPVWFPVRSEDGKPSGFIYVDEPFDNFDQDVLKSSLNGRGWVFQERALARRTIHFAKNQTYWECGEGVRCETLTKMKNNRVGFLGDPNFPSYGMHGSKGGDIVFYEDLYEQYSHLKFSKDEDRPFAIMGLEQRLLRALKEKNGTGLGYWGIFDQYWGRGLLWRRASSVPKMKRLTKGATGGSPAPSWSWEGHSGGIVFMKPEGHTVQWLADEVILPWKRAQNAQSRMTTATYQGERSIKGIARDFNIPEGQDSVVAMADVIYDDDADRLRRGPLKCLIVGRMKVENRSREEVLHYVLILAKEESGAENVYERIGAGSMIGSFISFDKNTTSVLVS